MNNIPKIFGKYETHELIGQGGFADVHRATDTDLERDVALKILKPILLSDPGFIQRFLREAKMAANLRHPQIVTIYEMGEVNGRYYIAMDRIPGPSLREHLRQQGKLSWDETMRIMEQVTGALNYAHQKGVVHRDLKPANILLDPQTGAVLTDFGFARLVGENSMNSLGSSGGVVGTPAYIPVEVWEGQKATAAADVYALGCMVYEMVTGETLFPGETPITVMRKHDRGAVLPALWPDGTPPELTGILTRTLAKEPAQRQQDAGTFMQDIVRINPVPAERVPVERISTGAERVSGGQPVPRAANAVTTNGANRTALKIGGSIAAAIALLFAAFFLGGRFGSGIGDTASPTSTVLIAVAPDTVTPSPTSSPPATSTHTPTATPTIRQFELPSKDEVEMVYVPAGTFMMGSEEGDTNEAPVHEVYIDSFWIDRTEATNAQFSAFVLATGYETTAEKEGKGYIYQDDNSWTQIDNVDWQHPQGPDSDVIGLDNHPVVLVSWDDASTFCEWRDARLPDEAEWEKAARGDDERIYPWGNSFNSFDGVKLNFCDSNCPLSGEIVDDDYKFTSPVGSYLIGASPYNVLDMAGNVSEWTASWYDAYPNGDDAYDDEYGTKYKVVRGGGWSGYWGKARSASRGAMTRDGRIDFTGFRCASSLP